MIATAPRPTTKVSLHPQEIELLGALYQHRLLTGMQIQEMIFKGWSEEQRFKLVRRLRDRGLIDGVLPRRGTAVQGKARVWWLTELGTKVAEPTAPFGSRRKQMTEALAGGLLQQHTLALNDVGLAFMKAAAERGDDFGHQSWEHEHRLPTRPNLMAQRAKSTPIADAFLAYRTADGRRIERFIEVDRDTEHQDTLAEKLLAYDYVCEHHKWGEVYAPGRYYADDTMFPEVLVVLAGPDPSRHLPRIKGVANRYLERSSSRMGLSFARLTDLQAKGPWARANVILRLFSDEDADGYMIRWADWLGQERDD